MGLVPTTGLEKPSPWTNHGDLYKGYKMAELEVSQAHQFCDISEIDYFIKPDKSTVKYFRDEMSLFKLIDTHGLPLDIALDTFRHNGIRPSIFKLVVDCHKAGWKPKTWYPRISHAFKDVYGPKEWVKIKPYMEILRRHCG